MKEKPGYFAVIPSAVRYADIPPNAKLLYGEISALCNAQGYCWASDKFFAENFDVTTKTIGNLIAALAKHGFILIQEEEFVSDSKVRHIYLNPAALVIAAGNVPKTVEKIFHGTENNFPELENFFQRIYCSNNKNNNIPPVVPQGGEPPKPPKRKREPAQEFEPERFSRFWDYYRSLVPAGVRIGGKQSAREAWNRLKPDKTTRACMLAALQIESATEDWQRGSGIKYVSTWLNAFRRGDICETGTGSGAPVQQQSHPAGGWD